MSEPKKEDRVRLVEQLTDLAKGWDQGESASDTDADEADQAYEELPRPSAAGLSPARKRAIAKHLARRHAERDWSNES